MNLVFSTFQSTLCNSYFLIGLLTTIYYWTKAIFFSDSAKFGFVGLSLMNLLLVLQLSSRWIISGHFPLSSLYESLLFLAWGINSIYLVIEYITTNEFIGVLVSPILLCLLGFAGFSLPPELQEMKPLVPALQSNWLFMHVSVMMLSYAGLLVGSVLSIAYLVIYISLNKTPSLHKPYIQNQDNNTLNQINNQFSSGNSHSINLPSTLSNNFASPDDSTTTEDTNYWVESNQLLTLFDNLSYRTIGIGFCFLTLGILSGAVWANETWGTYWSWDPKETWALITWAVFAIYLHTRLIRGWSGAKSAGIATVGFITVWVCYLGVNILGKGLHSYGFFN
jgi:cytochrome c-type biogenesis protein CcsB